MNDFETVIESVKRNSIKRTFPLTLILDEIIIRDAVQIMKRLEQENDVSQKLLVQYRDDNEEKDRLKEVLS